LKIAVALGDDDFAVRVEKALAGVCAGGASEFRHTSMTEKVRLARSASALSIDWWVDRMSDANWRAVSCSKFTINCLPLDLNSASASEGRLLKQSKRTRQNSNNKCKRHCAEKCNIQRLNHDILWG
jgi:hypothetical protein